MPVTPNQIEEQEQRRLQSRFRNLTKLLDLRLGQDSRRGARFTFYEVPAEWVERIMKDYSDAGWFVQAGLPTNGSATLLFTPSTLKNKDTKCSQ